MRQGGRGVVLLPPFFMVKNRKAKGTRNEHRSMALFESIGYACSRSGASLGIFDFIAIGPNDILLVQVKTNAWPRSIEMDLIRSFVCPSNCRKIVHRWRDRQRLPDIKEL